MSLRGQRPNNRTRATAGARIGAFEPDHDVRLLHGRALGFRRHRRGRRVTCVASREVTPAQLPSGIEELCARRARIPRPTRLRGAVVTLGPTTTHGASQSPVSSTRSPLRLLLDERAVRRPRRAPRAPARDAEIRAVRRGARRVPTPAFLARERLRRRRARACNSSPSSLEHVGARAGGIEEPHAGCVRSPRSRAGAAPSSLAGRTATCFAATSRWASRFNSLAVGVAPARTIRGVRRGGARARAGGIEEPHAGRVPDAAFCAPARRRRRSRAGQRGAACCESPVSSKVNSAAAVAPTRATRAFAAGVTWSRVPPGSRAARGRLRLPYFARPRGAIGALGADHAAARRAESRRT
jgi:hypothetical protein